MDNINQQSVLLSVINDLVRMRTNLDNMDASIKGVSQLRNRLRSIFVTLEHGQYQVPDLIGKTYHEGDNIIATLEYNPNLPAGCNRIKRVIKPQISFEGKLVQAAEVIVEYND